jgi:hypothetical protein
MLGRPFSSDADRASALAAAAWKINVVMLVHTGDGVYPIGVAQADRNALVTATFPTVFESHAGDNLYHDVDLAYVFAQSAALTAP